MNTPRSRAATGVGRADTQTVGGKGGRSRTEAAAGPPPPAELALEVSVATSGALLVAVVGELDMATAPAVERCVQDQVRARPGHLIVDLSRTTFLSARGVELLVTTRQLAEDAGVGLHVVGVEGHRPVERVLQLTRVLESLTLHRTVPGALAALS